MAPRIPRQPGGMELHRLIRYKGLKIHHLAWSPDGRHLAIDYEDGAVRIWETQHRKPHLTQDIPRSSQALHTTDVEASQSLSWSPDGRTLAIAAGSRMITGWAVDLWRCEWTLETQAELIWSLCWCEQGEHIRLAAKRANGDDACLELQSWHPNQGTLEKAIHDADWKDCFFAYSCEGRLIAIQTQKQAIEVWDLLHMGLLIHLESHGPLRPYSVALSPDERTLAVGLESGEVEVWDCASRDLVYSFHQDDRPVHSVAFSADGRILASCSMSGTINFFLTKDWSVLPRLETGSLANTQVELAFNPSQHRLATVAGKDATAKIWDLDLEKMEAHKEDLMIPILFLSANPIQENGSQLRLGEEVRRIQEKIRGVEIRNQIDFHPSMATRLEDLQYALLNVSPRIVHFSGHGSEDGAIYLENQVGEKHPVHPEALANLFSLVCDHTECVILNACYSKAQAEAIAQHIDYVIGMTGTISDQAAITFSVGFYLALGARRPIPEAFEWGRHGLGIFDIKVKDKAVLVSKKDKTLVQPS